VIGTTLAHYRITAELGAGGMGEVWRAEDTKLGREVALKVLPEEFAKDPERMARFEREAKVLASRSTGLSRSIRDRDRKRRRFWRWSWWRGRTFRSGSAAERF
jgi:hypothetical protein